MEDIKVIGKKGKGYMYTKSIVEENGEETGEVIVSVEMEEFGTPIISNGDIIEAMNVSYAVSMLTWFSSISENDEEYIKKEWKKRMERYNHIRKEVEELIKL